MTQAAPGGADDPFRDAISNLRETTKWLIGGSVTTAVAVLVGSPLTNLGALHFGWRLVAAICGALMAYLLLGLLLWRALGVVAADYTTVAELAQIEAGRARGARTVRRIAERLRQRFPPGCQTFGQIVAKAEELWADTTEGSEARRQEFKAALVEVESQIGFEYKYDRFVRVRRLVFWIMPFVIVGVGVFAWAANPPPEPKILSGTPMRTSFLLSHDEAQALAPSIGPDCYRPTLSGGLAGEGIVLQQIQGRTEIVTLPPGNCQPVRLSQQGGRWFVAH